MYNWDWKALLIDNGTPFTASPILKETACGGTEFYLLLDITVTEGYVTLTFPAGMFVVESGRLNAAQTVQIHKAPAWAVD